MKSLQTIGLMGAMLTVVCAAGAQTQTLNVGVPLGSSWNPGGGTIIITQFGREGQVIPVGEPGVFTFTTASAGDLILVNPTGGNAPSNWLADLRFFNPLDPTGTQGLAATQVQTFFPNDVGPGGFAAFALLPHYNLVPASLFGGGLPILGSENFFGPVGGINAGQLAVIFFTANPTAVPEPGSLALLVGMGTMGAGFLARRRRNARTAA